MPTSKSAAAAISLFVTILFASGLPRASASSDHIPSAAGRTTISGEQGSLTLRVPKRVTVSTELQNNPDIAILGRGDLVGISLIPLTSSVPAVFIGQVAEDAFCGDGDCPRDGVPIFVRGGSLLKGTIAIEPATYKVYLFGEGPISARLRLHGLSGKTTLHPSAPAKLRVDVLTPAAEMPAQNAFSWYGGSYDLGGAGQVFSVLWWKTTAHVDTETDYCLYADDDRTTEPHAFGCPFADADYHYSHGIASVQSAWNLVDWTVWGLSGELSQGWTYASAGVVEGAGGVALWLPY